MLVRAVLCLSTLHYYYYSVSAQGECTDLRGRVISNGLHYVPGPDTCTLCVCDNGLPKVCKAVLCSPPQDCHSFRMGNTCCEFICLDDVVKPAGGSEADVRLMAGGVAAGVLLALALLVYRVRRQKRRRPAHADDQRSLTSIGYISGSMAYMGGTCETALGAWKPAGNYLPRGEAPPPYDEAVAQCRADPARVSSETSFHRSYPTAIEPRSDDPAQYAGHGYVNIPRPVTQMPNTQNCYNAPLLQPVHSPEGREAPIIPHHSLPPNVVSMGGVRLTGSLGAISGRLSVAEAERERPQNVPGFYATHAPLAAHAPLPAPLPLPLPAPALHRTIPRISGGAEARVAEALGLARGERAAAEVRRSFHRAERAPTGRSVPRNLNMAAAADDTIPVRIGSARGRIKSDEQDISSEPKVSKPKHPDTAPQTSLPLTVDKPSCVCSYEGSNAPGTEDADDYRSECENCKSTNNPGWGSPAGEWTGGSGTQTLQRRAPPPPAPPPATATLPQPVTRHPRTGMGQPSNWENWFNTIPDSDTESEEE